MLERTAPRKTPRKTCADWQVSSLNCLSAVQMAIHPIQAHFMRYPTVAGSAAFNLLLISAVCIVAVPEGQTKSISEFSVFLWTAFMSVFAYFWMLVVYKFWTPDEVTIVEAVLTLLFLPLLVGIAYILDRKPWKSKTEEGSEGDGLTRPHLYQVCCSALVLCTQSVYHRLIEQLYSLPVCCCSGYMQNILLFQSDIEGNYTLDCWKAPGVHTALYPNEFCSNVIVLRLLIDSMQDDG